MALIETDPGLSACVFDKSGGTHTGSLPLLEMGPDRYNDLVDILGSDDITSAIAINSIRMVKHSRDLPYSL